MLRVVNILLSIAVSVLGMAMLVYAFTSRPHDSASTGLILGIIFLGTGLMRLSLYRRLN